MNTTIPLSKMHCQSANGVTSDVYPATSMTLLRLSAPSRQLCVSDLSTTEQALCNEFLFVVALQKYS